MTNASTRKRRGSLIRSGLNVSRLTLGTANFGSRWGPHWTVDPRAAERLVARAFAHGVCALDTANVYNQGESEDWVGRILETLRLSNRVMVSTKFGYLSNPRDRQSGGSGRTAMRRAVEISLRRLRRETIDLLYLHLWDRKTSVEETLSAAAELVAAGHIRAFALSNVPSWYLARASLLYKQCHLPRIAALQLNYNLLTRHLELDFGDLLDLTGIDMIAWGPLANGLLSGRYHLDPATRTLEGVGRLAGALFTTGTVDPFAPEVSRTLAELRLLSCEIGMTPAQIAVAWLLNQRLPTSVVIGVSNEAQLTEHLEAAQHRLDRTVLDRLDAASKPVIPYPQRFLEDDIQVLVHGPRVSRGNPQANTVQSSLKVG